MCFPGPVAVARSRLAGRLTAAQPSHEAGKIWTDAAQAQSYVAQVTKLDQLAARWST